MTKSNKFIALTLTTVISTFAIGTAANAEDMVKVEMIIYSLIFWLTKNTVIEKIIKIKDIK